MKAEIDVADLRKEPVKAIVVKNNDIIDLNVGGQNMTTKRSTLCQVEGSRLAAMFCGKWEEALERDKDNCVFLDFNPQYFNLILDYLRAKKVETSENRAPLPMISPVQLMNFSNLVRYLGLEREMTPNIKKCVFKSHSPGITVEDDGAITLLQKSPYLQHEFVFSENIYEKGLASWKLNVEHFTDSMFIGLIKADTSSQILKEVGDAEAGWRKRKRNTPYYPNHTAYKNRHGAYGWVLRCKQCEAWKAGMSTNRPQAYDTIGNEGETVELLLNCAAAKLSLVFPDGQKFHMFLPRSEKWKLHIGLGGNNNILHIISP